jgi:acylphosphatase
MSAVERCVTAHVTGRVQGVGFRYWTMEEAARLGLCGWVRNEPDGSVRALLAGPDAIVEEMLALLWKGPAGSAVKGVVSAPASLGDAPPNFRITR